MRDAYQGLRESLLQLGGVAAQLPSMTPESSLVAKARDALIDRFSLPDAPSEEQQASLLAAFRRWLDGEGGEPGAEDWAFAPFVYLQGEPPLGDDRRFADRVESLLAAERLPRMLKRAVYVYLRDFSGTGPSEAALGALIVRYLPKHHGRWAEDWLARARAPLRLFDPEGLSQRLADRVWEQESAPRSVLRQLGFSTELTVHCGVHGPLADALVERVHDVFTHQGEVEELRLQEVLGFLRNGDAHRFPARKAATADRLLGPFAERPDPGEAVRTQLTEFFDRLYGDPQDDAGWAGVSAPARAVMRRWVVRRSLDLFFEILSKTADPIWRYRRAFWLALYRHGLIEDAWPAFGNTAQRHVRSQGRLRALPYGELRGGQSQQSVMLMKMRGGFTVAEWSHAGACRIWGANDGRAPDLGDDAYVATQLREDCLYAQTHSGAMSGIWQNELSTWIAQRTGVRISLSELMGGTHA